MFSPRSLHVRNSGTIITSGRVLVCRRLCVALKTRLVTRDVSRVSLSNVRLDPTRVLRSFIIYIYEDAVILQSDKRSTTNGSTYRDNISGSVHYTREEVPSACCLPSKLATKGRFRIYYVLLRYRIVVYN